jgi:hypothetical protein
MLAQDVGEFLSTMTQRIGTLIGLAQLTQHLKAQWIQGWCKMPNSNWTPRARFIGELLTALAVVGAGWVLFVGTWFALGGN